MQPGPSFRRRLGTLLQTAGDVGHGRSGEKEEELELIIKCRWVETAKLRLDLDWRIGGTGGCGCGSEAERSNWRVGKRVDFWVVAYNVLG